MWRRERRKTHRKHPTQHVFSYAVHIPLAPVFYTASKCISVCKRVRIDRPNSNSCSNNIAIVQQVYNVMLCTYVRLHIVTVSGVAVIFKIIVEHTHKLQDFARK